MRADSVLRGALFVAVYFVALPGAFIALNERLRWPRWQDPVLIAVGTLLILAALGVCLSCARLFWRLGRGTPVPSEPPGRVGAFSLLAQSDVRCLHCPRRGHLLHCGPPDSAVVPTGLMPPSGDLSSQDRGTTSRGAIRSGIRGILQAYPAVAAPGLNLTASPSYVPPLSTAPRANSGFELCMPCWSAPWSRTMMWAAFWPGCCST